ncbi:MAG TPA: LysE family translocator [Longimicrobium sp.]|jgi:threonine/homoserine/homoserine lactone efflux protein
MPPVSDLLAFMAATLALNVTPGPDMLYVIARSVGEGRRAGVVSALGISTGTLFHTAAVVLGVSAFLVAYPTAYDLLRYAGAAYLAWLGVRALRTPAREGAEPDVAPAELPAIFRQGVITNVLNPKVAIFFLAFLPQFVDAGRGSVTAQLLVLAALFITSGTLVNVAVALAAGHARTAARRAVASGVLPRVTGFVFLALALRLAIVR